MAPKARTVTLLLFVAALLLHLACLCKADNDEVLAEAPEGSEGPDLTLSFKIHGWLMWVAFGLLMPSAIIVAAYFQSVSRVWFQAHWIAQLLALALVIASFSLACAQFDAIMDSVHSRLGIAVFVLTCTQPALAIFRPSKGTRLRLVWFSLHWVLGMITMGLGWFDLFLGIDLLEENIGKNCKALRIALACNVLCFVVAYVILARWEHLTSQLKSPAVVHSSSTGTQLNTKGTLSHVSSATPLCEHNTAGGFACQSSDRVAV